MMRKFAALAGELSLDDLRRLLAVKEQLTVLESRRSELETELAAVRTAIADLVKGGPVAAAPVAARRGRGPARRKAAAKKSVKKSARKPAKKVAVKKAAAKKTVAQTTRAKKKIAKKASAKKPVAKKKTAKKPVGKKKAAGKAAPAKGASRKAAAGKSGKATLESVVAGLIRANGGKMSVQDILGAIAKGKLVKSKSGNFANVLRRTLSTSKILVSAGRGQYKVK